MDGFSDAVSITAVSTKEKAACGRLFQFGMRNSEFGMTRETMLCRRKLRREGKTVAPILSIQMPVVVA